MKQILITSGFLDLHARAAAFAFAAKGHRAVCWCPGDFPTQQTVSLEFGADGTDGCFSGVDIEVTSIRDRNFDAMWYRRFPPPTLPDTMHPGDRQIAMSQCRALSESTLLYLDSIPFWVNDYSSARRAESKPLQLRLAREIGLSIPRTLMSNDPDAIRTFMRREGGKVAYKLFGPANWVSSEDPDKVMVSYTTVVRESDLPADEILRLAPGIFQTFVNKEYELRVTCFGDHLVATRLNSQARTDTELDWRQNQHLMPMEPWQLPEDIANKCRELMRRLNIVYGAIDFIVTADGEHVFLEINQQGQFLWIEDRTGVPVLDMACEFLLAGKREFEWREDHEIVRLKDFDAEAVFAAERRLRGEVPEGEAVLD